MFVELIDQLRCPAPHETSWLVLFADESRDRHILRGTVGCPVCGARYPIEDGTVWFTPSVEGPEAGAGATARPRPPIPGSESGVSRPRPPVPGLQSEVSGLQSEASGPQFPAPDPLPLTAVAAFLDLAEPGGIVASLGEWAHLAEELGDIVERVEIVAIAPETAIHAMQSAIMPPSRGHVPLADGSLRAAAVDRSDDADAVAVEAARLVRSGGRILGPTSARIPAGVRELTRNDHWWIGEREEGGVSGIVPLSSRRSKES